MQKMNVSDACPGNRSTEKRLSAIAISNSSCVKNETDVHIRLVLCLASFGILCIVTQQTLSLSLSINDRLADDNLFA